MTTSQSFGELLTAHFLLQVAYTPEVGGDYFISVRINGVDIQDSPFTVSSDSMPREVYLEMYRSIEPDFGRKLQEQMLGISDTKSKEKEVHLSQIQISGKDCRCMGFWHASR